MPPKRRHTRIRKLSHGLQDLIDSWDPIGLLQIGAPKDEYECLVGPILSHLERGDDPVELATWLQSYIADHFEVSSPDARAFAKKVWAWHREQLAAG
jgi:hypothetical protein